jgi:hypothetical protein
VGAVNTLEEEILRNEDEEKKKWDEDSGCNISARNG